MLLRAFGTAILFTGLASAQAPAAERAPRGADRGVQTSRAYAAQTPAPRVRRNADRDLRATQTPAAGASGISNLGAPQAARTPAERASRTLNQDVRADRFRDAAENARGDAVPMRPEVQQFQPQRHTLQPDVGRPEQNGRLSTAGTVGGIPALGSNVQR